MIATAFRTLGVALVLTLFQTSVALAITIDFVPSASTFEVGDVFEIDVVVSDIPTGQVVSAYDLDVSYDESLLGFSSLTFGEDLGTPPFGAAVPLAGGMLNVFQTSLLFDFQLLLLQGPSVTLFTIEFEALAPGESLLAVTRGAEDIKGVESDVPFIPSILDVEPATGTVGIVEAVAEPATGGILALAFLGWLSRRRKRPRS